MERNYREKSSGTAVPKKKNLRFVTKNKWELPMRKTKHQWNMIFENIEEKQLKVNESLFSLFPTSSLNNYPRDNNNGKLLNKKNEFVVNEPIVRISPPSPSHNDNERRISVGKKKISQSVGFLKNNYISNFDIDFKQKSLKSNEKEVIKEKINENEEEKIVLIDNLSDYSQIAKITRLTKISRYVNDFLASTKIKVKATISPRNYVHPLRETTSEMTRKDPCIIENKFTETDDQRPDKESPIQPDAIEENTIQINQQKHVAFEDNINYLRKNSRPRAPSLGVASLVPSFGKIISSLEYSESLESKSSVDTRSDDLNELEQLTKSKVSSKNFLQPIAIHYPIKRSDRGQQYWSHKTIVHTIRALKAMKAGTKIEAKRQQQQNVFVSSPLPISSFSSIGKSPSSSVDCQTFDKDLSQSSSSSVSSTREETVLTTIHVDNLPETVKSVSSLIQNIPFTIKDLPPLGGIYQRKKKNKCLACLYRWKPKFRREFIRPDQLNKNNKATNFEDFLAFKLAKKDNKIQLKKKSPTKASHESNICIPLNNNSEIQDGKMSPLEKKTSLMKEDLKSSKTFISTLSLSSDRSRTISDQEDSDQGPDVTNDTGEELPGSGSKYRAPCHAPLNWKPSLEPLLALKGKKSKSIQSRVASLEKSIDEVSEEDSDADDDDDIDDSPKYKAKEMEIKNISLSKPIENKIPDEITTDKIKVLTSKVEEKFSLLESSGMTSYVSKCSEKTTSAKSSQSPFVSQEIYRKLNVIFKVTEHNPSQSFRPVSPIMFNSEVLEIAEKALNQNESIKNILKLLLQEYSNRLSKKLFNNTLLIDHNTKKIEKMTNQLLTLLVDSKLYLNPEFTSSNLEFSSKQKPFCSSHQLRRFLPFKSYNLVAPILGMPEWYPKRWTALKSARSLKFAFKSKKQSEVQEDPSILSAPSRDSDNLTELDLIVHPPSVRESLSDKSLDTKKSKKLNPYAAFMSKPKRKAVIWRDLNEHDLEGYDPEATLKKRAARVTENICKDFCDWLRSLGGTQNTIDEETLKDMFETDFSAEACRTMQVAIKEMPMVPTVVATMRYCPEASQPVVTKRQLIRDVIAEKKHRKVIGFGSTVSNHLRYEPPNNNVNFKWIQCQSVPKDLETMSFVWKDITNLDSVKGFSNWLQIHSDVKSPGIISNEKRKSLNRKSQ